jgi:hypothetical protein
MMRSSRCYAVTIAVLSGLGLVLATLLGAGAVAGAAPNFAPLLAAEIAVSSAAAEPAAALFYTATLANLQGFAVAAEVQLPVPAHVSYTNNLSHTPGVGTSSYVAATNSVAWVGSLPAGETLHISYGGVVDNPLHDGTVITAVAEVNDYFNPAYGDVVTTAVHSEPDLALSWRTLTPASARPGEVVTAVLHVENSGETDTHVYVTDTVPSCLALGDVGVRGIVVGPDYIYWDFRLDAGRAHVLTYTATVRETDPATGGSCRRRTATETSQVDDTYHPVFEKSAGVWVRGPLIELVVSTSPLSGVVGEAFTYTVALTNTGDDDGDYAISAAIAGGHFSGTLPAVGALPPGGTYRQTLNGALGGASVLEINTVARERVTPLTATAASTIGVERDITYVYLPLVTRSYTPPCDFLEPNDDFAQATPLVIGTPVVGIFSYDADEDFLVFDVASAGNYTMQTGDLGPDTDTILYLFDEAQALLWWNDDAGPGQLWSTITRHLEPGRYYLKVEDYDPRQFGCDHTYSVSATPAAGVGSLSAGHGVYPENKRR